MQAKTHRFLCRTTDLFYSTPFEFFRVLTKRFDLTVDLMYFPASTASLALHPTSDWFSGHQTVARGPINRPLRYSGPTQEHHSLGDWVFDTTRLRFCTKISFSVFIARNFSTKKTTRCCPAVSTFFS